MLLHGYFSIIAILFATLISLTRATSCSSFKNVLVKIETQESVEKNVTIDGCLERSKFENETVKYAFVRFQKIPELGPDSVRNMKHLITVSFYNCDMESVEPGAFREVPDLKRLQVSFTNITEIQRGIFDIIPSLEQLRLHNNKIDTIEYAAFSHLPNLKKIHLDYNHLDHWNKEWFVNTTELEIMDFQYNQIRSLPRNAFNELKKLKQIFFDENDIDKIYPNAFGGLSHLEYLGLRNNRLKRLDAKMFPNELSIRSLLINANFLNFLSNELLDKLSVRELTLDGNPWKCGCLERINYWMYEQKGIISSSIPCKGIDVPLCMIPITYSQTCIENVDEDLTKRFLELLRSRRIPLENHCARLD